MANNLNLDSQWYEYTCGVMSTECDYSVLEPINYQIRVLHGVMGLVTESGELLDCLKKNIYYGQALDKVNIEEELGDICYYLAMLLAETGLKLSTVMDNNLKKLAKRYPDGFTSRDALERNLEHELSHLKGRDAKDD